MGHKEKRHKKEGGGSGGGGNTKCQHKHKLISDAINVNKRSRLISQYICVCLYRIIHVWMTTRGSWHEHTACAQVGREHGSVGEGGRQASKAIKINNFQYFALMEKQRKTRASRVFSNEASDVTRPRNLNFSQSLPTLFLPSSSLACQCQYWGDKAKENAIKKLPLPKQSKENSLIYLNELYV